MCVLYDMHTCKWEQQTKNVTYMYIVTKGSNIHGFQNLASWLFIITIFDTIVCLLMCIQTNQLCFVLFKG